jgi:hypothetical protein
MGKGGLAPCDDLGSPKNSPDVTSEKKIIKDQVMHLHDLTRATFLLTCLAHSEPKLGTSQMDTKSDGLKNEKYIQNMSRSS